MLDRSRLTRLVTCALASCAVTWALAVAAPAMPEPATPPSRPPRRRSRTSPGTPNKVPTTQPAASRRRRRRTRSPNPAQVQRVLNGIDAKTAQPVVDTTDDTGTVALDRSRSRRCSSPCGAVTLTLTRPRHPVVGA